MKTICPLSMLKHSALALALCVATATGAGATLVSTMGEQDFTQGQWLSLADYNAAQAGEPAPFDTFYGNERSGPDFTASWAHDFVTPVGVSGASITLGIYDDDGGTPGSQVASFLVDGVDYTSVLNSLIDASTIVSQIYNIYTVNLTGFDFANFADGVVNFSLALQGPSQDGQVTPFLYNGAGLDFATLTIDTARTPDQPVVPEPASLSLIALGLTGLGALRRKLRTA